MRGGHSLPRSSNFYNAQRSQIAGFRSQRQLPSRQSPLLWKLSLIQPPVRAIADVAERSTTATEDATSAESGVGDAREGQTRSQEATEIPSEEASTSQASSQTAEINSSTASPNKRSARTSQHRDKTNKTPVPAADFPYNIGDQVLGKVVREDPQKGWRVELVDAPGIIGLCPSSYKPFTLRDSLEDFKLPSGIVGLVRMFKIERIPEEMFYNGHGPVVSAMAVDLAVVWRRAEQIRQIHEERTDTLAVKLRSTTHAGILGVWDAIPLFIPWKFAYHYDKRLDNLDKDATAKQELSQAKSYVRIVDVNPYKNRFVGSLIDARQIKALEGVQIGDLMTGFVIKVASYGVFVRMHDKKIKGLLHIKNVSCKRVSDLERVFQQGDSVSAFLVDVDEKNQCEFSTLELESYAGEMLDDAQACMKDAASKGSYDVLREKAMQIRAAERQQNRSERNTYSRDDDSWNNGPSRRSRDTAFGEPDVWRSRDEDAPQNSFARSARTQFGQPGNKRPQSEDLDW